MKAYLTTIGEKTTDICRWNLERFGFEVIMLNKLESWIDKYKNFINIADENCLRIDSDVLVNKNINDCLLLGDKDMVQFQCFDIYRNDIWVTCPVFYGKTILQIIRNNIEKLDLYRPETSAWRLPDVLPHTKSYVDKVYGSHGLFQDEETMKRAYKNKQDRNQLDQYDFELINKLYGIGK